MEAEQELLETTDGSEPEEPVAEPEVTVSTEPPEGEHNAEAIQLPTVVILVERPESGPIDVDVVAQGDVRATEIETILKMGLNKWRNKINLPG